MKLQHGLYVLFHVLKDGRVLLNVRTYQIQYKNDSRIGRSDKTKTTKLITIQYNIRYGLRNPKVPTKVPFDSPLTCLKVAGWF